MNIKGSYLQEAPQNMAIGAYFNVWSNEDKINDFQDFAVYAGTGACAGAISTAFKGLTPFPVENSSTIFEGFYTALAGSATSSYFTDALNATWHPNSNMFSYSNNIWGSNHNNGNGLYDLNSYIDAYQNGLASWLYGFNFLNGGN